MSSDILREIRSDVSDMKTDIERIKDSILSGFNDLKRGQAALTHEEKILDEHTKYLHDTLPAFLRSQTDLSDQHRKEVEQYLVAITKDLVEIKQNPKHTEMVAVLEQKIDSIATSLDLKFQQLSKENKDILEQLHQKVASLEKEVSKSNDYAQLLAKTKASLQELMITYFDKPEAYKEEGRKLIDKINTIEQNVYDKISELIRIRYPNIRVKINDLMDMVGADAAGSTELLGKLDEIEEELRRFADRKDFDQIYNVVLKEIRREIVRKEVSSARSPASIITSESTESKYLGDEL